MGNRWNHINSFIKNRNETTTIKRQIPSKNDGRSTLHAQVIKPVKQFDYKIETFITYVFYALSKPHIIVGDERSSRYFIFAALNFLLYLVVLFFVGATAGGHFNWQHGTVNMMLQGLFTIALILFTFFIQLLSINRMNTIYKVFVDTISYFSIVSFIGAVQVIFNLLALPFIHELEIISFLIIMSIPMRLFTTYNEKHHFDIDVFKLNLMFIVLIVIYMALAEHIPWTRFLEGISSLSAKN
ncbi:hypothetical protein [Macrococcus equipercicus]|uniref:Uncharacterized protein n=1 Tax=Macrococcus equipercicus TaxID=69967 RepID=A0A9Q9BRY1_9STAP|nr:hypothetical protein [Macrococcus equipercicus]KAA1042730.1 hypothetical protein ERX35_002295 [Macrococcus equipercicus]UTH14596.1 hypothetical protein KFV11_04355 [Macrococcus equipercicus]